MAYLGAEIVQMNTTTKLSTNPVSKGALPARHNVGTEVMPVSRDLKATARREEGGL